MTFSPGALMRARNREWVVLPESDAELLVLRPLGGTDREIAGAMTARAGADRRRGPIRSLLEPDPPRTARRSGGPLRTGRDGGPGDDLLRGGQPDNVPPEQARNFLARIIDDFSRLSPRLSAEAEARGREMLESHRSAAHIKGLQYRVEPQLPPDVLGIYVFLPVPGKSGAH